MARIPQGFIDEVLERTDIVALVDARVGLKKAGREYQARCPFHDENTPSFTISPAKQFYHCFGCGAHGTAISFLMAYDRLEFRDAVEVLAGQAGLELPADAADTDTTAPPREPLFNVLAQADRHYRRALRASDHAIDYLKNRGVSGELARRYGLGYAPDSWSGLTGVLADAYSAERAGLIIARDSGGHFDRFRNRLMFPIRDTRGRTIAFGGRALGDDKAKYLNSPETPLFHKSDQMYGLFEARQALRDLPRLLVVEGYMDVIALAQHGFDNAVATLGTATTAAHLTTLFRHTEEVIFCFDGDAAGLRAARKALEQSLPVMRGTRRVRFLFLPEGEDPDTLVRAADGPARFRGAINDARPAASVLLDQLTDGAALDSADGRALLIERARPYVNALPPEAFRAEILHELAELARLPANDLRAMYADHGTSRTQSPSHENTAAGRSNDARTIRITPVTRALMLLLADPALAARADPGPLHDSSTPGATILAEAIEFFTNNPKITVSRWLERYREHRYFERLQQIAAATPPGDTDERTDEFLEAVRRLCANDKTHRSLRERYNTLVAQQERGPLDQQAAQELKDIMQQMQKTREQLS